MSKSQTTWVTVTGGKIHAIRSVVLMIDPNEIQAGDLVIIQDSRGNVISGPVVETVLHNRAVLALEAFGFKISFARMTDYAHHGYELIPGIALIEHQGAMVNSELYIRSKAQLQRNKHLRSNPT